MTTPPMMIESQILMTLQQATIEAVEQSDTPTLPIKFLDRPWTIPNDNKYLEEVIIINNPPDPCWNSEKNYQGIYRLILHWPISDEGRHAGIRVLAAIARYFSKDRPPEGIQITNNPDAGSPIVTETEILYPFSLRYQRFATN